jgi:hypothetical protein
MRLNATRDANALDLPQPQRFDKSVHKDKLKKTHSSNQRHRQPLKCRNRKV